MPLALSRNWASGASRLTLCERPHAGEVAKNTESGFAALCLFYSWRESLAALSLCYFCEVGLVCRVL